MRGLVTDREVLPMLADFAGIPYTANAQLIAEYDNGIPVAIGIFDQYNGRSVHVHMWIAYGRRPSRVWYWAMHDYPFWKLGVTTIVATILESNEKMVKLVKHLGGELVGRVPDYGPDGSDLLIYAGVEENMSFWHRYENGRASPPDYNRNMQQMA